MPERYYYPQQQYGDCSGGRGYYQQPCIDGGQVYQDMRRDHRTRGDCRPCYPQQYGQQQFETLDAQQYQKKLDETFTKAHQIDGHASYKENLFTAAEQKKPVVMVFGRSGDPNNGAVLDAVARAKQQHGDKAEFMYVDLSKVDPRSEIGKYATQYIGRAPWGTPMTMVFNQKQGPEKTPVVPERPLHWQLGGPLDEQRLSDGILKAYEIQKNRTIDTGRKQPDAPDAPEVEKPKPKPPEVDEKPKPKPPEEQKKEVTPQDVLSEVRKPYKDQQFDKLLKDMDKPAVDKLLADTLKHIGDTLKDNPEMANRLQAQVLASFGLATIKLAAHQDALGSQIMANDVVKGRQYKDLAQKDYMHGMEYILSAGDKNRQIYRYPDFAQALRDSALPGNAANYLIERGIQDESRPQGKRAWCFPTEEQIKREGVAAWKYEDILKAEMAKQKQGPRVKH